MIPTQAAWLPVNAGSGGRALWRWSPGFNRLKPGLHRQTKECGVSRAGSDRASKVEKAENPTPPTHTSPAMAIFCFLCLRERAKLDSLRFSIASGLPGHVNIKRNSYHSLRLIVLAAETLRPRGYSSNCNGSVSDPLASDGPVSPCRRTTADFLAGAPLERRGR